MKLRHTIFNSIGLGVASFVGYSCFGTVLLIFFTHVGLRHPGRYIFQIFYDSVIIFGVGGSALVNLASGRLKSSPTLVMVVVYFLSIFLFPLGIWGIVELLGNSNKKYRHRERIDRYVASPKKNAAGGNLARVRWLAALSWFIPSAGIILVAAAGSMHHEALIQPVISVSVVGVLLSLIFGLYALFNVSEYGHPVASRDRHRRQQFFSPVHCRLFGFWVCGRPGRAGKCTFASRSRYHRSRSPAVSLVRRASPVFTSSAPKSGR